MWGISGSFSNVPNQKNQNKDCCTNFLLELVEIELDDGVGFMGNYFLNPC